MKISPYRTLFLGALIACAAVPAQAGEPDFMAPPMAPPTAPPMAAPSSGDDWEFIINPYTWLFGMDGTVGIGNAVADVDSSIEDVWDNLEFAFNLTLEVRKGRWGVEVGGSWARFEDNVSTAGALFGDANLEINQYRVAPMLSYRVLEGDTTADILAGVQYFRVESDFKLNAGMLPSTKRDNDEDWWDPMVGARIVHQFSDRFFAYAGADIGGFGVSSDFIWQAYGALGYRLFRSSTIMVGYRHLDIDYEDGGFVYDLATSGFTIGSRWQF